MKIVTLTLNPAFDVHCYCDKFEEQKENIFEISSKDAGGKGLNISRALSAFGVKSTAFLLLGNDNADSYLSHISDENIAVEKIITSGRIRENITIHPKDNKETRICFKGFSVNSELTDVVVDKINSLCDSETILTFTGSIPNGLDKNKLILKLKNLSASGTKVILDSKSLSLNDIEIIKPFLIKPNQDEVANYLSLDSITKNEAVEEMFKLKHISDNIIVSFGDKGAVLLSDGVIYDVLAPKINVISTIGAGDSMIAGFICGYNKLSKTDCLRLSVAFGSAACLTDGTNPPNKQNINKIYASI